MKIEKLQPGIVVEWVDPVRANVFFDPEFFGFDELKASVLKAEIQQRSRGQCVISSVLLEHGMIGVIYNPSIIKCFRSMSLEEAVRLVADSVAKTKVTGSAMTMQNDDRTQPDSRSSEVERLSGGTMVLPGNDR